MRHDPGQARRPPALKRLGQHFLSDPRLLARIADAAELAPDDTVIEIGPGRGALTEALRARAGRLILIELDRALAARLRKRYADDPRVTLVEGDVLETDLGGLAGGAYVLVGNVPYYITTPILFHALRPPRFRRAVFLVQREVAERMGAAPGTPEYGALSVNLQALAQVEVLFRVPAGAFQPPPKVESAVVRLTPREHPAIAPAREARFRAFVQEAFSYRRKQMRRVVRELTGLDAPAAEAALRDCGIDPATRPETLAPETFAALLDRLEPAAGGPAGADA
jgi:16S rRNA (adenine1518-N6/adenine1519-N6)-dimethyltransferase